MVEYDVVQALRYLAKLEEDDLGEVPSLTLTKAADEIERLRRALELTCSLKENSPTTSNQSRKTPAISSRQKALNMRNAIDSIELALNGIDRFHEVEELWEGASADLPIKVAMTVGTMRQIRRAYDDLNHIINSPEYTREIWSRSPNVRERLRARQARHGARGFRMPSAITRASKALSLAVELSRPRAPRRLLVQSSLPKGRNRPMTPLENAHEDMRILRDEYRGKMNRSTDAAQRAAAQEDMAAASICSTEAERYREAFAALNRAIQIIEEKLD